ncbi:MAG: histidinol dehydrogenase [Treponema sp.]|nr:histidinol dehydrogenase [Treponema sp.]
MKIITGDEFKNYWKANSIRSIDKAVENSVREIIESVRTQGDEAVHRYSSMWDKSSPDNFTVPYASAQNALRNLQASDPGLAEALKFSAENIRRFSLKQREQFADFEFQNVPGIFTGQKIIPVNRAGVYIPGGRYPLISSTLMCLIPAICAGVKEICLASPPAGDGFPDQRILASAAIVRDVCGFAGGFSIFSMGGAQAIAALALGTETVPRCDVIAGPGNKYVAEAKRILYGETGIDLIAGPSDILVIAGAESSPDLIAADMIAQAEHDPDARARALLPSQDAAQRLAESIKKRLHDLPSGENKNNAGASLQAGGLIIVYKNTDDAVRIANAIAPEHLELHVREPQTWAGSLVNYGSLFIGESSAEVLGDYSSGLNHTLPTLGSARFTGGLSVRHFLKTVTTLRCEKASGSRESLEAAKTIARAESLESHAWSAEIRLW